MLITSNYLKWIFDSQAIKWNSNECLAVLLKNGSKVTDASNYKGLEAANEYTIGILSENILMQVNLIFIWINVSTLKMFLIRWEFNILMSSLNIADWLAWFEGDEENSYGKLMDTDI